MNDINEIKDLINTVGFPILSFLMIYRMCNTTLAKNTETVAKNTELLNKLLVKFDIKVDDTKNKEENGND